MVNSTCKIYYDSEYVSWTIPKENIMNILLGYKNKLGLLFLDIESAGEIQFKDTSCKINNKKQKLCNKIIDGELKFKKGDNDSVMTPLSIVNFHTHPLKCYIDGKTIWGWPSGEDLSQCLNFAKDNNLTHIVFTIEGTYIIDVNKVFLNYILSNNKLFKLIRNNIEEIFKFTHKYRICKNDIPEVSLEQEFNEIFLKPIELSSKDNILLSWLNLVNNLTLDKLIKLSNRLSQYNKNINKIPIKLIDNKFLYLKIFSILFFKNDTIQWKNNSNIQIFDNLNKIYNSKKYSLIKLPNELIYTAPFVSEKCDLQKQFK